MRRLFLFVNIIFFPFLVSSQPQIDSLINLLNQTEETTQKVDLLNEISDLKQPNGGKEEAMEALQLAKKLADKRGTADAYANIGFCLYFEEEHTKAAQFADTARMLFQSLNIKEDEADVLFLLSSLASFQEKHNQSLVYLLAAEKIGESIDDNLIRGAALHNLANLYWRGLDDDEKAKGNFLAAVQLLEKEAPSFYLLDCYFDLAFFYLEEDKNAMLPLVEKGEACLQSLTDEIPTLDYQQGFAALRGYHYLEMKQIDSAKRILNKTLPYFESNQNHHELMWHYASLGEIALSESNFMQAVAYGHKAMEHDIEGISIDYNLDLIRDAYKNINKDSFLFYSEKYIAHTDTLDFLKEANKVHQTIKQEALKAKDTEIQGRNYILYLSILVALLLAFGLLKLYQSTQQQMGQVNQLEQEKNHIKTIFEGKSEELEIVKEKVKTIERSLLSSQLNLERQQSSLSNIAKFLKQIVFKEDPEKLQRQLRSLSREIESSLNQENRWQLFTKQFEKVHPQFFSALIKQFPDLNNRDLRLCAYIRLGMDNQEIAEISGIESKSVMKAKHRMKKKMGLEKEQSLNSFLFNLKIE